MWARRIACAAVGVDLGAEPSSLTVTVPSATWPTCRMKSFSFLVSSTSNDETARPGSCRCRRPGRRTRRRTASGRGPGPATVPSPAWADSASRFCSRMPMTRAVAFGRLRSRGTRCRGDTPA